MSTVHDAINAARGRLQEPPYWDFGDTPCPGDPEEADDPGAAWLQGYVDAQNACYPNCVGAYWFDRTICDWVVECESCDGGGGGGGGPSAFPRPSAFPNDHFWDKLNKKWNDRQRATAPSSFDAENENETF